MKPIVSIIIPLYNAEKYLRKCLDSILKQTFKDFEILLVNDGSTDGSEVICKEYCQKDSRVKLFCKDNGGVSSARNLGLENSSGDYISFIDSDDYVKPNFIESLYNRMPDCDYVLCGYIKLFTDGATKCYPEIGVPILNREQIEQIIKNIVFEDSPYNGLYSVFNKMYRREFIADLRFDIKRHHGEDWWFNLCLYDKSQKIGVIEDCLYYYSISNNANSLSKKFNYNYIDHLLYSYSQILPFAAKYNLSMEDLRAQYIHNIFNHITKAQICLSKSEFEKFYSNMISDAKLMTLFNENSKLTSKDAWLKASIKSKSLFCFELALFSILIRAKSIIKRKY